MKLNFPISLIDCDDIGIDFKKFQRKISLHYGDYADDLYLLEQNKLDFLKSINLIDKSITNTDINKLDLDKEILKKLKSFKATRKRLICECFVVVDSCEVKINRIEHKGFGQNFAEVVDNILDYRKMLRKFKELPDVLFDENLRKMIDFVARKIYQYTNYYKFKFIIHYVLIECVDNQQATNSPEGIHQDGMDIIMSAFVVERENIKGGQSVIYCKNKTNKIFECILKPGQGILQADLNSYLWHEVTPIVPLNSLSKSYRSSIGFDVEFMQ